MQSQLLHHDLQPWQRAGTMALISHLLSPYHTRRQKLGGRGVCKGSNIFPETTHLTTNVDFLSNMFQDADQKLPMGFLIFGKKQNN